MNSVLIARLHWLLHDHYATVPTSQGRLKWEKEAYKNQRRGDGNAKLTRDSMMLAPKLRKEQSTKESRCLLSTGKGKEGASENQTRHTLRPKLDATDPQADSSVLPAVSTAAAICDGHLQPTVNTAGCLQLHSPLLPVYTKHCTETHAALSQARQKDGKALKTFQWTPTEKTLPYPAKLPVRAALPLRATLLLPTSNNSKSVRVRGTQALSG